MNFIPRHLAALVQQAARDFPAVVVLGPRQTGKTTLLQQLFTPQMRWMSLELPDTRLAAQTDPRGFLDLYPPPVIFDEVQHAPDLLPHIKERIDADRARSGQYLLTGSQNLLLMQYITESLAGRTAILRLLPLQVSELLRRPAQPWPWEQGALTAQPAPALAFWPQVVRGFYPELAANPERDARLWLASYIQTYLERDVRTLRQVGSLTQFQLFLRSLATRCGQLLNLSEVARDVGVAVNTARNWLAVLEATFQVALLRPYHTNLGKRLVKTPKVYFLDTGLVCALVGLRDPEHAAHSPMSGTLVENAIVAELIKAYWHAGQEPPLYFWRTTTGDEVDVVVETATGLVPIEIKQSATPRPDMAAAIQRFRQWAGARALPGYVLHPGTALLPLGNGTLAYPWTLL